MTPHPGEAAALLGKSVAEIQADRFAACRELNKRFGGVCVLKGAGSLIGHREAVYVNATGNPGMATAGMGDILSGIIAGLLAQSAAYDLSIHELVACAVFAHGRAADLAVVETGEKGLLATDLYPYLMRVLQSA